MDSNNHFFNRAANIKKVTGFPNLIIVFLVSLTIIWLTGEAKYALRCMFEVEHMGYKQVEFLFINLILFGPLKEENLFRAILRFNRPNLLLCTLTIFFCVIAYMGFNSEFINIIILSFSVYFYFLDYKSTQLKLSNKNLIILILITNIFFWIFHILTYKRQGVNELIVTMPLFIAGIALSYVRLKINLITAFLIHMSNNLISYIIFHK